MKKLMMIAAASLLVACGGNNEDNNTTNNTNNGGDAIAAGNYTVTVQNVDDQCFDGAINTIILPDGMPRELPAPVALPASGDLPGTIDIDFNDPFQDAMGVEVVAAGNNGIESGAPFAQDQVDISDGATGGCLADMTVSFSLTQSAPGTLTGEGTLTVSAATGDDCPAFTADAPPCDIVTDMTAVLQE